MRTLPLTEYKTITANTLLNSPEFRAINKEKENKVDFNTK